MIIRVFFRVLFWIVFDVDVESCVEFFVIVLISIRLNVVVFKSVVIKICVGVYGGREIFESVGVVFRVRGGFCYVM